MTHLLALSGGAIAGIVVGGVAFVFLVLFLCLVPLKSYLTAIFSGNYVSAFKLISLRFRKVQTKSIVDAYISSRRAKLNIKFKNFEVLHLAGGSCKDVVEALLQAKSAGLDLNWEQASAIELASHDILPIVQSAINPKVIEIKSIKGITKDNVELEVQANITVKARIDAFVGAVGEDTLASKVTKYISAKIQSLHNHKNATPYNLAQDITKSNLDLKNAYELISCDVVSINISRDIGAEQATQSLERIKVQAQIDADRQKNNAIIETERSKAKTQEMKNAVLQAEAEVPKAIAEAIRDGRFSVMDYYKLMNLQADTAMRRAMISGDNRPE